MTDLEITKLCAEAMGWICVEIEPGKLRVDVPENGFRMPTYGIGEGWIIQRYRPLHDDAQAMALVKRFCLDIHFDITAIGQEWWCRELINNKTGEYRSSSAKDLNRAICECVAKMQKERSP